MEETTGVVPSSTGAVTADQESTLKFPPEDLARDIRSALATSPGDPATRDDLDPFLFMCEPSIARRLARWVAAAVPDGVERVVGAGGTALGLALVVGLELGLPSALVTQDGVSGEIWPGDHVVVVGDITRSGETVVGAMRLVDESGAETVGVHIVLDRGEGAMGRIAEMCSRVKVLIGLPGDES